MKFIDTRENTSHYINLCKEIKSWEKELKSEHDWFTCSFIQNIIDEQEVYFENDGNIYYIDPDEIIAIGNKKVKYL